LFFRIIVKSYKYAAWMPPILYTCEFSLENSSIKIVQGRSILMIHYGAEHKIVRYCQFVKALTHQPVPPHG
uniref:hypothetical protein n=1 Tax=Treponema pedis TaxID=409322 RepID=UPI00056E28CB